MIDAISGAGTALSSNRDVDLLVIMEAKHYRTSYMRIRKNIHMYSGDGDG